MKAYCFCQYRFVKKRRGRTVAAGSFRQHTARNDWIMTISLIIAVPLAAAEEVVKY